MTIADLYEDKSRFVSAIRELAGRQESWTAEDRAAWDKANADYDAKCAEITAAEDARTKSAAVLKRLEEIEEQQRQAKTAPTVSAEERRARDPERIAASQDDDSRLALNAWVMRANRHGSRLANVPLTRQHSDACSRVGINPDADFFEMRVRGCEFTAPPIWLSGVGRTAEKRADAPMYIAGSNVGSQFVPQGFVNAFEKKMVAYDGPRSVARIFNTSTGNSLPWPTVDDTGNSGALLAEATAMADAVAATTGAITFAAYKYESKPVFISQELMEDAGFDCAALAGELCGERIGRAEGVAHTTGTGSSQPKGVVTCATAGVTAASATSIEGDDLLGLIHTLDPAYRMANASVGFMMHDNILLHLRKKKDGDGQYLWQPGLQMGVPDRLLGYPIAINQNMQSSVATGTVTVLFADFSKFLIRDVAVLRFYRLDEAYRAKDLTGFCAFHRTDSNTIATVAIRKLTQA